MTFKDILAFRGRVVIFTATAAVGLRFEQFAERSHAHVICTRGWADPYGPLGLWHRVCASRDYAVLSCDQQRYIHGFNIPATDLVWVGDIGSVHVNSHLFARYNSVMRQARDSTSGGLDVRVWTLTEDALQ